jgi:probable selenium-dependent hydroxylase accessory protein YqeC
VWQKEARRAPHVFFSFSSPGLLDQVNEGLDRYGHVFLGEKPLESGKVKGIDPDVLDVLFSTARVDYLILEADGAAGRPLKVPYGNEPVIPPSSTLVVAMMGLDALGKTLEPEVVFRLTAFEALTGLKRGKRLTPEALARGFLHPEGLFKGCPVKAERIVFLNKGDLHNHDEDAWALADLIINAPESPVSRVVLGSILKGTYEVLEKDHGRHQHDSR